LGSRGFSSFLLVVPPFLTKGVPGAIKEGDLLELVGMRDLRRAVEVFK